MRAWVFVLSVACATTPGAPAPNGDLHGTAAGAVPDAPRPSAQEEVCLTLQRAFQARLDSATGTCQTDFDCGCYRGVAPGLGCGGITDFTSSTALAGLTTQFTQAGCAFPTECTPRPCVSACVDGRCGPLRTTP